MRSMSVEVVSEWKGVDEEGYCQYDLDYCFMKFKVSDIFMYCICRVSLIIKIETLLEFYFVKH